MSQMLAKSEPGFMFDDKNYPILFSDTQITVYRNAGTGEILIQHQDTEVNLRIKSAGPNGMILMTSETVEPTVQYGKIAYTITPRQAPKRAHPFPMLRSTTRRL